LTANGCLNYLCKQMNTEIQDIIKEVSAGNRQALARAITLVENEIPGYEEILLKLRQEKYVPVIGITGPPGSGKSTLVNSLISVLVKNTSNIVGVISVDPSSPIHNGAILGDRLRMNEHFNNKQVFIRSLATRGALGGLSAKAIEVTELMRCAGFDYILVETAGVGQSEVEIAGLADITLLVLTPEAGDEIQAMKSGIMEIADIFVVNKADREGADEFSKNLYQTMPLKGGKTTNLEVVKTIATQNEGVEKLADVIKKHLQHRSISDKSNLWAEKAYRLILRKRMADISKEKLKQDIEEQLKNDAVFNIYSYINRY
jgi:LAO/AO transport system kinase